MRQIHEEVEIFVPQILRHELMKRLGGQLQPFNLRIPTKAATYSNLIAATIPI